jgi:hypothetical protein
MAVALVYYAMNLRNANKTQLMAQETRQASLFMQIYNQFTSERVMETSIEIMSQWEWSSFEDFQQKYGASTNPSDYSKFMKIINYFEGVGILLKRGLIDVEFVSDLMGAPLMMVWEKTKPVIVGIRDFYDDLDLWDNYEYLVEQVNKK